MRCGGPFVTVVSTDSQYFLETGGHAQPQALPQGRQGVAAHFGASMCRRKLCLLCEGANVLSAYQCIVPQLAGVMAGKGESSHFSIDAAGMNSRPDVKAV